MKKGERIKALRVGANLTQEELAKLIKTTKQTIYKYENGLITNIPSDSIEDLAQVLHTTPAYLMGWDIDVDQSNNRGTISNNIGSDSSESNNTYTTNSYFSSPCAQQKEAIVNHDVSTSINSKELFFELLIAIKDMTDEQLEDMIKYAEFTVNR